MDVERFDTVVIGAGQAGLWAGAHLRKTSRSFVILDANDRVGDTWRQRYDSLRLFTPARYVGLPGWPFPAKGSVKPTKDEMADYLESYAERFALPVADRDPRGRRSARGRPLHRHGRRPPVRSR